MEAEGREKGERGREKGERGREKGDEGREKGERYPPFHPLTMRLLHVNRSNSSNTRLISFVTDYI